MIEALDKAYVIGGEYEDSSGVKGMLIYDFKQHTWDYNDTPWERWSFGVVNHLAFDDPSSGPGYIVGFAGIFVSKTWHYGITVITHTASYCALVWPNECD